MINPNVKVLYKYYPALEDRFETISKGMIYIPSPSSFNDPFDTVVKISEENDFWKYGMAYVKEKYNEGIKTDGIDELESKILNSDGEIKPEIKEKYFETFDFFNKKMNQYGVLSLSSLNDHILMWSNYADSHKGFCVGINRVGALSDEKYCFPMRYIHHLPHIHIVDAATGNIIADRFGQKNVIWSYENEWRYIDQKNNIKIKIVIDRIIIGASATNDTKKKIINIGERYPSIKIMQAVLNEDEYQIKIQKI